MLGCFGNFQSTNDYCMSYHCISVILLSGTQVWPKRMIHVCGSSAQCIHGCIVQDPLLIFAIFCIVSAFVYTNISTHKDKESHCVAMSVWASFAIRGPFY